MQKLKTSVVIIDDHLLTARGLASLVESYKDYTISFIAGNGKDFIEKLNPGSLPSLVMVDISMPVMNGYETTAWIRQHYPQIKILAHGLHETREEIKKMIDAGANGYVPKTIEPSELRRAFNKIIRKGFYHYYPTAAELFFYNRHNG